MFKNIQTKIVLVFAILGIIVITALGIFFLTELNNINQNVGEISIQTKEIKMAICLALIAFMLGTILCSFFVSKVILRPISKLMKSVEEISREKQRNIKLLSDGKNRTELDDLVDAFGVDAVRYYVLHEIPYANDGTLTYELLIIPNYIIAGILLAIIYDNFGLPASIVAHCANNILSLLSYKNALISFALLLFSGIIPGNTFMEIMSYEKTHEEFIFSTFDDSGISFTRKCSAKRKSFSGKNRSFC